MEFKTFYIEELLKIKNGKDHKALNDGNYPVYGSGGLMRYAEKYLYDKVSILLPRKGTLDNIQYVNEPFWTVDTIYYTEVNERLVNPYYLFRYLRAMDLSGYDSGASIPSMTTKTYNRIKVKLPPLVIQNRITDVIRNYDELIELNNKRIKLLEKAAEELYKEWFVRFRFPNYQNTEFENGIPKGWSIQRMKNFCYVTDGTHDTPKPLENGFPLVTGKCINNGFIDFKQAYCISEADHRKIERRSGLSSGDIIFSNIGTVGNCCIIDYSVEFSVKNVIIFKPENMFKTSYLYYWMISKSMQELFSTQTNGASQQFVGLNFIRNFKILIPNTEVLLKFNAAVEKITKLKQLLFKNNENLIKQRDLLLPRLMSGKLEV